MNYGIICNDPVMKKYFDSLPVAIQQNLIHSGVEIKTIDELETCIRGIKASYLTKSK